MGEIVFVDEFLRSVREFDSDIFWAVKRSAQIKIGNIKAGKLGTGTRENTVDNSLDEFKGSSVGADIAWITDAVATNGDSCLVGFSFLGPDIRTTLMCARLRREE